MAVGNPGSGTFESAERVFRAIGIWDKINRIPLLGAAAGEAMSEGKADAFFWTGPELLLACGLRREPRHQRARRVRREP